MNPQSLIAKIRAGETVEFTTTLAVIDAHYQYTPTAFANGVGKNRFVNRAGENEGSCKVLAFARQNELSEPETLALFGEHYQHVLAAHEDDDHRNIRTFMQDGWAGIEFTGEPLRLRR